MKKIIFLMLFLILLIPSQIFALSIECPNVILIDADTGRVLYENNSEIQAYPASTTKIMTAILSLENAKLDTYVTANYSAVMSVPVGGSNTAIQVGEALTVKELLQALLIASGNDAANILAEHIGGSTESFASMMNTKAKEIGCTNTNFVNANGLHDENHYSSAHDLAIMYKYAWDNFSEFRDIVSTVRFRLPITEKYSDDNRVFINSNRLIIPSSGSDNKNYYYEYTTGGKTGYTTEAKNCLVASASKNGFNLIAVVLGGTQDEKGYSYRFMDTKELFEYGFANLSKETIAKKDTVIDSIKISNAPEDNNLLNVILADSLTLTINLEDVTKDFVPTVNLNEVIEAPVKAGDKLGTATYTIYGTEYIIDLVAGNDIEKQEFSILGAIGGFIKGLFTFVICLAVLVLVIRFYNKVLKKKRRRALFNVNRYNSRFH
ncbi:MAG: D-alanyl-D-alanine carboxypeptidase [Clostridia bacterium]|nr:D-alanyl-D-alanine carboxypeptidase [Clostridia bacterium]